MNITHQRPPVEPGDRRTDQGDNAGEMAIVQAMLGADERLPQNKQADMRDQHGPAEDTVYTLHQPQMKQQQQAQQQPAALPFEPVGEAGGGRQVNGATVHSLRMDCNPWRNPHSPKSRHIR